MPAYSPVLLSDRGDLRVGEDDARHGPVVGPGLLAEHVAGGDPRLVLADVRERHDPRRVPDPPDPVRDPKALVDRDRPIHGRDAHALEPEAVEPRAAARGDQQPFAPQLGPVIEAQHVAVAVAVGGGGKAPEPELDAVRPQRFGERLARPRPLARDEPLLPLDDGDGDAHPPERLADLDPHRPATQDEQRAGELLDPGRLAVGPYAIQPVKALERREGGLRAGGDHDPLSLVVYDSAVAAQELDPLVVEPGDLARVVPVGDHEVPPAKCLAHVDPSVNGLTRARGLLCRRECLARPQQRLRRDTGPVGALAGDQLALDDRNPKAAVGELAGTDLARRTRPDHDRVERPLAHAPLPWVAFVRSSLGPGTRRRGSRPREPVRTLRVIRIVSGERWSKPGPPPPTRGGSREICHEPFLQGLDERLVRGVIAGIAAGLLFLLANMWYADSQGLPAVAPLYDISTIFHFSGQPDPVPQNAAVGLVVHLALSAGFGALFAASARAFSSGRALALGATTFGLALYLVNFQILGRVAFEWFQEGPNQTFEVIAHAGYGLLLAPFLAGYAGAREHEPAHARTRLAARRAEG